MRRARRAVRAAARMPIHHPARHARRQTAEYPAPERLPPCFFDTQTHLDKRGVAARQPSVPAEAKNRAI